MAGDDILARTVMVAATAAVPPVAEGAVYEHCLSRADGSELLRARSIWQPSNSFSSCVI